MDQGKVFDVAVIGGGIIGCATAHALTRKPGRAVVILEAEEALAAHQTGRNSGVVHSGLYYKPGSEKAKRCAEGREALFRFLAKWGIPNERCGKVVVATRESELAALDELERRGRANGLVDLCRIGKEELRELEPHARGIAALHVRETGIADYAEVTRRLADLVAEAGGEIRLSTRVEGFASEPGGVVLETRLGAIRARSIVNCAGLQSDRVARLCGVDPVLRIVPFRGEYYEVVPERRDLVRNLVYPVPDPRFPFLGVHFTRMVRGGVEAGPNAVLALKREGYRWRDVSPRDMGSYLFFGGFWKMALTYGGTGLGEIWRSWSKRAFVAALQRLVPEIAVDDVRRAGAGVRAQALEPSGALCDDFRIVEADRQIHVLNAPSPAATASLSIGATIADLWERRMR